MDPDPVTFFKFKKQGIIELLGPILFQKPIFVMALPSNVKGGAVCDNKISWIGGHEKMSKQRSGQIQRTNKMKNFSMGRLKENKYRTNLGRFRPVFGPPSGKAPAGEENYLCCQL